ncbi:unnamed protein product [Chrysoparadoxa australica]
MESDTSLQADLLIGRLATVSDEADRREALASLVGMSSSHPCEVADSHSGEVGGLELLRDTLQAVATGAGADPVVSHAILEIICNLVQGHLPAALKLLDDTSTVQALLDMLESKDAASVLQSIQVLQALQMQSHKGLEDAILQCPAGLQQFMDLLGEPREELRNASILLLTHLTSTNEEVKKFLAFQEGFERLFGIMAEEGMISGGVIVLDCLEVCTNILRGESAAVTQALFCQSNCLNLVHQLLNVRLLQYNPKLKSSKSAGFSSDNLPPPHGDPSGEVSDQGDVGEPFHFQIMLKALGMLDTLLGDKGLMQAQADHLRECQTCVFYGGNGLLPGMLTHAGFSRAEPFCTAPARVKQAAMEVVRKMVRGNAEIQGMICEDLIQDFGTASLSLPALLVEGLMLSDNDNENDNATGLQEAHMKVLVGLYSGNALGCAQFMSHIVAPPPPPMDLDVSLADWVPPTPAGKALLEKMQSAYGTLMSDASTAAGGQVDQGDLDKEGANSASGASEVIVRSCAVLSLMLEEGGAAAQEIALRVPIASAGGGTPLLCSLMQWVEGAVVAIRSKGGHTYSGGHQLEQACLSLLQLLCVWMRGSLPAVTAFLASPSNLFVVDAAAFRGDSAAAVSGRVRGLCCLLLGVLMRYIGQGDGQWSRETIMSMVDNRVGVSRFTAAIEDARSWYEKQHRLWRRRASWSSLAAAEAAVVAARGGFHDLLLDEQAEVRSMVIASYTRGNGLADGDDQGEEEGEGNAKAVAEANKIIAMQEQQIKGLKDMVALAESRLPEGTEGGTAAETELREKALRLEAELARCKAELEEVVAQGQQAERDRAMLAEEVTGLTSSLEMLEAQVNEAGGAGESSGQQADVLREEVKRLQGELEEKEQQAVNLRGELRQRVQEQGHVQAQLEQERAVNKETEESCSVLREELASALARAAAAATAVKVEGDADGGRPAQQALLDEMSALQGRLGEETMQWRKKLGMAEEAARQRVAELEDGWKQKLAGSELRQSELRAAVQRLEGQLAESERSAGETIAALTEEKSRLRACAAQEERAAFDEMKAALSRAEAEAKVKADQVDELTQALNAAELRAKQANDSCGANELASGASDLQLRGQESDVLSDEVRALQEEMSNLKEEMIAKDMAITSLEEARVEAEAQVARLSLNGTMDISGDETEAVSTHAAFNELREEHEDLLVLLAQQQLVKQVLEARVEKVQGKEGLHATLEHAKDVCRETYGDFIDFERGSNEKP